MKDAATTRRFFGRTIECSEDGRLLSQGGEPTKYVVDDLDVYIDSDRGFQHFPGMRQPGDHCVVAEKFVRPSDGVEMDNIVLLIREGRLFSEGHLHAETVMWD